MRKSSPELQTGSRSGRINSTCCVFSLFKLGISKIEARREHCLTRDEALRGETCLFFHSKILYTSTSHICLASQSSLILGSPSLFVPISRRASTMSIFTKRIRRVGWTQLNMCKINASVLTSFQLKATLYLDYQLLKDVTFIKRGPDEDNPEFKSLVYKYLYIILAISAMSILYGCFYRHKCGRDSFFLVSGWFVKIIILLKVDISIFDILKSFCLKQKRHLHRITLY